MYLIAPPGDENVSVNDAEVAPVARSEAFTSTYGLPIGDAYCVVPTAFVSVAPDVSPSSAIETMPGIAVARLFVTVIVCVTVVPVPEVVEQRFRAVVLSHHDQQASDDQNQTEHGQMLSSNMLLLNLILLIEVTFSTPTGDYTH